MEVDVLGVLERAINNNEQVPQLVLASVLAEIIRLRKHADKMGRAWHYSQADNMLLRRTLKQINEMIKDVE
jgi:hypothetical protein